jgi:hypothetical protein
MVAVACGSGAADDPASTTGAATEPTATTALPSSTTSTAATTSTTDSATTTTVPEASLPTECEGLGTAADERTVTFVAQGTIYEIAPDGTIACLTDFPAGVAEPMLWSPDGSRLGFADGAVLDASGMSRGSVDDLGGQPVWTAPTGQSLIYVNTSGTVTKARADDSASEVLVPLSTHDAVAYHPDGTTFAVAGSGPSGEYGIWIVANDGTDPRLLTFTSDSVIGEIWFNADASALFFTAHHADESHVHFAPLQPIDIGDGEMVLGPNFEEGLAPLAVSSVGISGLRASPAGPTNAAAFVTGECEGFVAIEGEDYTWSAMTLGIGAVPVGFLDFDADGSQRLVVAESEDCSGPSDLVLYTIGAGGDSPDRQVLRSGVELAAVRAPATAAAFTLAGLRIEPFA